MCDRLDAKAKRERLGAWSEGAATPTLELSDGGEEEKPRTSKGEPTTRKLKVHPDTGMVDITDLIPSSVDVFSTDEYRLPCEPRHQMGAVWLRQIGVCVLSLGMRLITYEKTDHYGADIRRALLGFVLRQQFLQGIGGALESRSYIYINEC